MGLDSVAEAQFFCFRASLHRLRRIDLHKRFPSKMNGVWPAGVGTLARRLNSDSSAETPSSSATNSASLKGISCRMRSRLLLPSSLGFSPDARNRSDPSSLLPPPSGFSPCSPGPDITFIHTAVTPQHRIDVPKRTASCKLFIGQAQAAHARRRSSPAPPAKLTA